jgi:uncharacterized protein YodC (DUF2158 family)
MQFQIGDVVRLKSGGPSMTIKHKAKTSEDEWYCEWFVGTSGEDAAKVNGHLFVGTSLTKVK